MNETFCKECLSNEVCKYNDGVNSYCKGCCPFFKDCSKFKELPCDVGDTVYSIKSGKVDMCQVIGIQISTKKSLEIRLMTKDYTFYDVSPKDFAKIFFLTKEEAEQALRGCENNVNL